MNKLKKIFKKFKIGKKKFQFKGMRILIVGGIILVVLTIVAILLYVIFSPKSSGSWQHITDDFYDPIDIVLYDPDIRLVDIRQAETFNDGHIKGAINIPTDFEGGNINNAEAIIRHFSELKTDLPIVIYGENSFTLRTIKVAQLLEQENIRVKVLRVGWTEFFHFQTFWLPDEISSKVNILNYIELPE